MIWQKDSKDLKGLKKDRLKIDCPARPGDKLRIMGAPAVVGKRKYSRASLEAGDRLLKAAKQKLLKKHGKIDYAALRRDGYSEALIARLNDSTTQPG